MTHNVDSPAVMTHNVDRPAVMTHNVDRLTGMIQMTGMSLTPPTSTRKFITMQLGFSVAGGTSILGPSQWYVNCSFQAKFQISIFIILGG